jgi:NAD(P)-dependent dehydrogenase (short-subunit alcohol dehydrogenase family)
MFQMPLHFNKTGVRVVAMCPGPTTTPIPQTVFFDKEWKTYLAGVTIQP